MPVREILFDLTEFLHDPQRSGIQRVCFEIVRHWPTNSRLVPACVDERSRLIALDPEALDIYRAFFQASVADLPQLKEQMRSLTRRGRIVTGRSYRCYHGLLNATVFSLPHQVEFYLWAKRRGLADRVFLLSTTCCCGRTPSCLHPVSALTCLTISLPAAIPNLAFNSNQTRFETLERVLRDGRTAGPVCPLGAESLGTAAPRFDPANRRFTVVGTVEPRNHREVLDAFDQLWSQGVHVDLTFAGRSAGRAKTIASGFCV